MLTAAIELPRVYAAGRNRARRLVLNENGNDWVFREGKFCTVHDAEKQSAVSRSPRLAYNPRTFTSLRNHFAD